MLKIEKKRGLRPTTVDDEFGTAVASGDGISDVFISSKSSSLRFEYMLIAHNDLTPTKKKNGR